MCWRRATTCGCSSGDGKGAAGRTAGRRVGIHHRSAHRPLSLGIGGHRGEEALGDRHQPLVATPAVGDEHPPFGDPQSPPCPAPSFRDDLPASSPASIPRSLSTPTPGSERRARSGSRRQVPHRPLTGPKAHPPRAAPRRTCGGRRRRRRTSRPTTPPRPERPPSREQLAGAGQRQVLAGEHVQAQRAEPRSVLSRCAHPGRRRGHRDPTTASNGGAPTRAPPPAGGPAVGRTPAGPRWRSPARPRANPRTRRTPTGCAPPARPGWRPGAAACPRAPAPARGPVGAFPARPGRRLVIALAARRPVGAARVLPQPPFQLGDPLQQRHQLPAQLGVLPAQHGVVVRPHRGDLLAQQHDAAVPLGQPCTQLGRLGA
jgi:hypothetical protein